ncbi:MAG: hypothetical protein ACLPYZ_04675 [Limisphaerales bacterium]
MNPPIQGLQIHIHKVDGSVETFTQSEAGLVNSILNEFHPARIFTREKIIIADGNSLTSFPVHQVVRIDLVSEHLSHWILPPEIVDAVELTETKFRALLQNPELGDWWNQAQAQEAPVVAFLDVEMAGQQPLFLALEVPLEPPADRPEAILYPLYPLTTPTLCFRMRTGGIAALNLLHLIRFTLFPAPQPAPAEAWPAHRVKNPQFKRRDRGFRGPAVSQPLPSPFQPNGQMNLDPSQRSQNENESQMEGKHQGEILFYEHHA